MKWRPDAFRVDVVTLSFGDLLRLAFGGELRDSGCVVRAEFLVPKRPEIVHLECDVCGHTAPSTVARLGEACLSYGYSCHGFMRLPRPEKTT